MTSPPGDQQAEPGEPPYVGSELEQLRAFADSSRAELLDCLDGLTEEQARRRLVPSRTTLLGLVKHAAFDEMVWFQCSLAGRSRSEIGCPLTPDESFDLDDADTIASVSAAFREAWATSERLAAAYGPNDLVLHNRRGPLTLRWVYVHLVEELARHAGHADILREQILAADG